MALTRQVVPSLDADGTDVMTHDAAVAAPASQPFDTDDIQKLWRRHEQIPCAMEDSP